MDEVDGLRRRVARRVELDFPVTPPLELADVPEVREVAVDGTTATCTATGPVGPLLKVAVAHGVVDVRTHEADLEEVFLDFVAKDRT